MLVSHNSHLLKVLRAYEDKLARLVDVDDYVHPDIDVITSAIEQDIVNYKYFINPAQAKIKDKEQSKALSSSFVDTKPLIPISAKDFYRTVKFLLITPFNGVNLQKIYKLHKAIRMYTFLIERHADKFLIPSAKTESRLKKAVKLVHDKIGLIVRLHKDIKPTLPSNKYLPKMMQKKLKTTPPAVSISVASSGVSTYAEIKAASMSGIPKTIEEWKKCPVTFSKNTQNGSSRKIKFIQPTDGETSSVRLHLLANAKIKKIYSLEDRNLKTIHYLNLNDRSYYEAGLLDADHFQSAAGIIAKIREMVDAMNTDPEFAAEMISEPANDGYFCILPNKQIVPSYWLLMSYYNSVENLWFLLHSQNSGTGKLAMDPIDWLRDSDDGREFLLGLDKNNQHIDRSTLFYRVKSNDENVVDGEPLKEVYTVWLEDKHKNKIETIKEKTRKFLLEREVIDKLSPAELVKMKVADAVSSALLRMKHFSSTTSNAEGDATDQSQSQSSAITDFSADDPNFQAALEKEVGKQKHKKEINKQEHNLRKAQRHALRATLETLSTLKSQQSPDKVVKQKQTQSTEIEAQGELKQGDSVKARFHKVKVDTEIAATAAPVTHDEETRSKRLSNKRKGSTTQKLTVEPKAEKTAEVSHIHAQKRTKTSSWMSQKSKDWPRVDIRDTEPAFKDKLTKHDLGETVAEISPPIKRSK